MGIKLTKPITRKELLDAKRVVFGRGNTKATFTPYSEKGMRPYVMVEYRVVSRGNIITPTYKISVEDALDRINKLIIYDVILEPKKKVQHKEHIGTSVEKSAKRMIGKIPDVSRNLNKTLW